MRATTHGVEREAPIGKAVDASLISVADNCCVLDKTVSQARLSLGAVAAPVAYGEVSAKQRIRMRTQAYASHDYVRKHGLS